MQHRMAEAFFTASSKKGDSAAALTASDARCISDWPGPICAVAQRNEGKGSQRAEPEGPANEVKGSQRAMPEGTAKGSLCPFHGKTGLKSEVLQSAEGPKKGGRCLMIWYLILPCTKMSQ